MHRNKLHANVLSDCNRTGGNIYIIGESDIIPTGLSFTSEPVEQGETFNQASEVIYREIGTDTNFKVYEMNLKDAANEFIHELKGYINVTLPIPEDFTVREGKTIAVYRLEDDGTLTRCQTVVKDGFITFATNHFSTYILAEVDADSAADMETDQIIASPKTGETTNPLPMVILLVSVLVVTAVVLKRKRVKL